MERQTFVVELQQASLFVAAVLFACCTWVGSLMSMAVAWIQEESHRRTPVPHGLVLAAALTQYLDPSWQLPWWPVSVSEELVELVVDQYQTVTETA